MKDKNKKPSIKDHIKTLLVKKIPWLDHPKHSIAGRPEGWPKTKKDYEEFWSDRRAVKFYLQPDRIAFYEEVLVFVPRKKRPILDVGCGNGVFLKKIVERDHGDVTNLVGVDYTRSAISSARKIVPEVRFVQANATDLPFENDTFEVVIMMEILEHLKNWKKALSEALRVLVPGGQIIITVPNGDKDNWIGHTNFWNKRQLYKDLLKFDKPIVKSIDNDRTLLAILRKGVN